MSIYYDLGLVVGRGLTILGHYADAAALAAAQTAPQAGDAYSVGTTAPYDILIWDGAGEQWVDHGPLQGAPCGPCAPCSGP